jgi:hypothetical protein
MLLYFKAVPAKKVGAFSPFYEFRTTALLF